MRSNSARVPAELPQRKDTRRPFLNFNTSRQERVPGQDLLRFSTSAKELAGFGFLLNWRCSPETVWLMAFCSEITSMISAKQSLKLLFGLFLPKVVCGRVWRKGPHPSRPPNRSPHHTAIIIPVTGLSSSQSFP